MNAAHIATAGGATPLIAKVLVWASHWPLAALDEPTAMAIAGLLVMLLGGGGVVLAQRNKTPDANS